MKSCCCHVSYRYYCLMLIPYMLGYTFTNTGYSLALALHFRETDAL